MLDPEPHEPGGVVAVDGGPTIRAVGEVARGAVAAVGVDDHGDEAVVASAVDGRREPYAHRAHAAPGEPEHGPLRGGARAHLITRHVLLTGDPAGPHAGDARGDRERPVGAGEDLAEHLDRGAIGRGGLRELTGKGDVVAEREVDDGIGLLGPRLQDVDVLDVAAQDLGARRSDLLSGGIGASQTEDVMSLGEELGMTADPIQPDAPVTNVCAS